MTELLAWSGLVTQLALAAGLICWFKNRVTGSIGMADQEVREAFSRLHDLSANVAVDVREHAAIVKRLHGELDTLQQLPRGAQENERLDLLHQITRTIETLKDKLEVSERKLDHEIQLLNVDPPAPHGDVSTAVKLTPAEASTVSKSLGSPIYHGPDRRAHPRQVMLKTIRIAPNAEQLEPGDYTEVQCFDISVGGISFFLPCETTERSFVVSLGPPDSAIFVRARVARVMPTKVHTQPMFLVGCQFTSRIGRGELPASDEGKRTLAV